MAGEKYRIKSPTIALFPEQDCHDGCMVPAGSVITIDSEEVHGDRLVEVFGPKKGS